MSRTLRVLMALVLLAPLTISKAGAAEDVKTSLIRAMHEIRYIKEGDPEVTTSKCIGNPVTPLCAAETEFMGSSNDDLREISYGEKPGIPEFVFPEPRNPNTFCYRLLGSWYYTSLNVPVKNFWGIEEGDVGLVLMYGTMTNAKCDFGLHPTDYHGYLMRRGQYGWYIVDRDYRIDYVRDPYRFGSTVSD